MTSAPVDGEVDAVELVIVTGPENVVLLETTNCPPTFKFSAIPTPPETTSEPVVDELDPLVCDSINGLNIRRLMFTFRP